MMNAREEAAKLMALGWTSEGVRDYHRSMCTLYGWSEDECEAVATALEGML